MIELSSKIVDCIQPFTIFAKHFLLGVSQGHEHASDKAKQNPGVLSLIPQKSYDCNLCKFLSLLNSTLSSHYIAVRDYYVFDFKLIHPYSWIQMILIRHYLPVQIHQNNYKPTFSNFFGERKEIQSKMQIVVLTLW